MIQIFTTYLFGVIEDNLGALSRNFHSDTVGNQPVYALTRYLYLSIHPVAAYNLLTLLTLVLVVCIGWYVYGKYFRNVFVKVYLVLMILFSGYLVYHIRSHLDLSQIWTLVLALYLLNRPRSLKGGMFLGLFTVFTVAISNYLGFFILLTVTVYELTSFFHRLLVEKKVVIGRDLFLHFLGFAFVFFGLLLLLAIPYLSSFSKVEQVSMPYSESHRSIDDVFVYSAKPWYYFLPSVDNPFYGRLSVTILGLLQKWVGWQAGGYIKSEHSADFLGLTNIFLAILGFLNIIKSKKISPLQKNFLIDLGITAVVLFFFSLPPQVSVFGFKLLMPSYIFAATIPIFRVIARFGLVVYLITLIFTGYGLTCVLESTRLERDARYALLIFLFVFGISEMIIPVKLTKLTDSPAVFKFLSNKTPVTAKYVVYPYSKVGVAQMWSRDQLSRLLNMRNFMSAGNKLNSEKFTNSLTTMSGLNCAKNIGAKYLVYFYQVDVSQLTNQSFFDANTSFVGDFIHSGSDVIDLANLEKFVIISDAGGVKSNSARLYRLVDNTAQSDTCPKYK